MKKPTRNQIEKALTKLPEDSRMLLERYYALGNRKTRDSLRLLGKYLYNTKTGRKGVSQVTVSTRLMEARGELRRALNMQGVHYSVIEEALDDCAKGRPLNTMRGFQDQENGEN